MTTFAQKLADRSEGLRQPHRNSMMMAATSAAISRGEVGPQELKKIDAELAEMRITSKGEFLEGIMKIVANIPLDDPDANPDEHNRS